MKYIDMVYCWCDGNDPNFKKRKEEYLHESQLVPDYDSVGDHRFIDNEELRYSLRSLEMYAPWIHHVYIVTDGQTPPWLDINYDKVSIVDHREIMPQNLIPCFNSSAIERYIVNIPNLSEYFLYGNDDMFFGRPLRPDFFFSSDGKPIVHVKYFEKFKEIKDENDFINKYQNVSEWMKTNLNAWRMLYQKYGRKEFYVLAHTIDGYKKSLLKMIINKYNPFLDENSNTRFRSVKNISRNLYGLDMAYSGEGILSLIETPSFWQKHIHKKAGYSWKCYCGSEDEKTRKQIIRFEPYLFCINASSKSDTVNKKRMRDFYELLFPNPSLFEMRT